jgi:hypothetical protein
MVPSKYEGLIDVVTYAGSLIVTADGIIEDAEGDYINFHIGWEGEVTLETAHLHYIKLDGDNLKNLLALSDRIRKANDYLDRRDDRREWVE